MAQDGKQDGGNDMRDALEKVLEIARDGMFVTRLGSKEDACFREIVVRIVTILRARQTELVFGFVTFGAFAREAIHVAMTLE